MDRIAAAADIIAAARHRRGELPPLDALAPQDVNEAYLMQDAVHARLHARSGARIGTKIGCTSAVMQRYLGITHPCAGGMFAADCHVDGATLHARDFVRLGVECEIAVRIGEDVPADDAPMTGARIATYVAAYLPAIELVDARQADWRSAGVAALIADDFFAAGCVLGTPVPRAALPDARAVTGRALINGTLVGEGTGADVMGHPHNALAWLAGHLAARGERLRRDEIVLTGSMVQTVWLAPGDTVRMEYGGFGSVGFAYR